MPRNARCATSDAENRCASDVFDDDGRRALRSRRRGETPKTRRFRRCVWKVFLWGTSGHSGDSRRGRAHGKVRRRRRESGGARGE